MKKATARIFPVLGAALAVSALLAIGESEARDRQGPAQHVPPPEAVEACVGVNEGMECSFVGRRGEEIVGTCEMLGGDLGCLPEDAPRRPRRGGGDS